MKQYDYSFAEPEETQPTKAKTYDYTDGFPDRISSPLAAVPKPKPTSLGSRLGDIGVTALKSAIGVPEAAIGLADIPTSGYAGKLAETAGFRPKEAKQILDTWYSPEQQARNLNVHNTEGFVPTLQAYAENPSVLAHDVGEQVLPMLGGGVISQGVRKIAPKMAPYIAGAIGEAGLTAGQNVEQVRQETPGGLLDPLKQTLPVTASGALTGAIAAGSGKIAQKLGLSDVQNILAGGRTAPSTGIKGLTRNIAGTALMEGAGQELPQSFQEQIAQNYALDKPLLEGAGTAAAQGLALGSVMGAGGAIADPSNYQEAPSGPLSRAVNSSPDAVAQAQAQTLAEQVAQNESERVAQEQETAKQADAANKKIIAEAKAKETAAKAQQITAEQLKQQEELNANTGIHGTDRPGASRELDPLAGAVTQPGTTPATTGTTPVNPAGGLNGASDIIGAGGTGAGAIGSDQPLAGANSDIGKLTAEQSDGAGSVQGVHESENLGNTGQDLTKNEDLTKTYGVHEIQDAIKVLKDNGLEATHKVRRSGTAEDGSGLYNILPNINSPAPAPPLTQPEITNGQTKSANEEKTAAHDAGQDAQALLDQTAPDNKGAEPFTPTHSDPADGEEFMQVGEDSYINQEQHDKAAKGIEITPFTFEPGQLDEKTTTEPAAPKTEQPGTHLPVSEDSNKTSAQSGSATGELPKAKTPPASDTQSPATQTQPVPVPSAAQPVANAKGVTRFSESAAKAILTSSKYPDVSAKTHEIVKDVDKWQVVKKTVAEQPEQATTTVKENLTVPQTAKEKYINDLNTNGIATDGSGRTYQIRQSPTDDTNFFVEGMTKQGKHYPASRPDQHHTKQEALDLAVNLAIFKEDTSIESTAKPDVSKASTKPDTATPEFLALPEKSQNLFNGAFERKDTDQLKQIVHPDNKAWRKEFEHRTGLTLPKGVNTTNNIVDQWAKANTKAVETNKARIKQLKIEGQYYVNKGNLTKVEGEKFKAIQEEISSLSFDMAEPLSIDKVSSPEARKSTIPSALVVTAHRDLVKNKAIYKAVSQAAGGVNFNADTPVDDIVNGNNSQITQQDLYAAFTLTREAMRKHYGDTVKLYRAMGKQKDKPTANWATTLEFAKQFGDKIESRYIPVNNILAVNVGLKGTYHEVIVQKDRPENTQATATNAEPVKAESWLNKEKIKIGDYVIAVKDKAFYGDKPMKVNHINTDSSGDSTYKLEGKGNAHFNGSDFVKHVEKAPEKQTWTTPEYTIRLDRIKQKLRRAIETTAFDALTSDPTAPADNDTIISDLLAHLIQEKVTAKQANDTGQQEMLDLMLDGNKITIPSEFIESVKKQRSKNFKDNELAKNREPAIYHEAVAKALIDYGKAGGISEDEITAFTQGFDHHLAGKTLSTLPPGSKTMIAGFKAAEDWTKTEEGNAWFKGEKRAKKLEATGTVLKRWFDKSKADIDGSSKTDADIAKAQIDAATTRAAFFRDIAGENPTPGLLRYLDAVRSKITPFKEWFVSELGLIHYRSERGWDSLITDYLKDGATIRRITDLKHDTVEQRIANLKQFAARYVDEIGQIVEVVAGTSDMRTASDKLAKAFLNDDVYKDMYKKIEGARGWEFYANSSHYSPLAKKLEALIASSDIRRLLPAYVEGQFDKENDAGASKPISPRNPRIEQVYRNGKDWRKGKDITPKQFKDKFGFADFNFGKYVTKKNDQDHLNYAYDALSDFAGLMDIDPKAIGFNEKLYFTIGALGHGKFAAHFSPNNPSDKGPVPVINLTNTKGDGTVSHEFFHALDELAPELDDAIQTIKQALKEAYDYDGMKQHVIRHLKGHSFFTRLKNDPVASARYALQYYRGKGYSDFYNAARALDKGNLSKPYWSNDKEPFARAGEAAVMDLLEDKQLTNNYLVNNAFVGEGKAVPPLYKGTPYPTGEERKRFKDWYSALFKAMSFSDGKWQFDQNKFRELAPKTSEDYERAIAGLSASIPDMYRQLQDEQRAGELLKDMEQAKQAKEKQEAERLALEAKLAEELADKARNETKPDPAGSVTEDEFDALFADVVSELKADDSEQAPVIAEERDKELLKIQRLSDSDKAFLLDRINKGERVLMAIKDFGLPTIHDFQGNPNIEVDHMGYGLMKAVAPDFTIHFDAGMDMQKTPGGEAYTIVRVKIGVFPYDFDSAKKALAITAKPEPKAKPEKAPETKTQASNAVEPTEKPVKQQVKKDLERIASLGVQGMGEVLNGLHELFGGGKGTLSSFPGGLDAEAYAKAKPHFEKALALFQEAGLTLRDMIKELVLTFGEGIQPYLKQFVMEKKLSVNLQEEKQLSGSQKLAGFVAGELKADRKFTWQTLVMMGNDAFNGTMGEGAYSIKDLYDAMEAGVNQYILSLDKYNPHGKSVAQARQLINDLNGMLDNIPTQTKRTAEMDEFQQFSTPPTEAFAANWVANIQAGEVMLEPSAGIGGLAIFSKLAGANIVLNELSQRRAGVLSEVFPGVKVYTENAEQLANVLPAEIQPSVIVMNPPFSSTAGRMEGKRNTMNGAKHIEQALKKLAPNGRLVAIVGQGMSMDAPAFKKWWAELQKKYAVRANISVNGAEYRKYGTTYDNQLLVIDKVILSQPIDVVTGRAETIADLIPLLEGIRNERIRPNIQETESTATEPTGKQNDDSGGKGLLPGPEDTGVNAPGERQPGELDNPNGTGLPGQRGHSGSDNGTGKTGPGKGNEDSESGNGKRDSIKQPESGGSRTGGHNDKPGLSIESTHRAPKEGAISDSIYENYQPAYLRIPGSKEHPGKLVESAAMAAVDPPKPTYTPNLPKATITQGKLSLAQLEATVYAGQSFEKFLKDGPRRGLLIGDGTGTGKGRSIASVILDAIRSGHGKKKAVWLSASSGLYNDSKDYYGEVGGDAAKVFQQSTGFDAPKEKEGVLFASYDWMRGEDSKTKTLNEAGQIRSHVDTLVAWLGKDFDGVIAFDESHKMQNAQTQSGKNASKTALAGIRLQELLPQARILYASATAATEVSNLLYADRLGLWGKGTAFSNKGDFVNQIVSAGTAAMEFVAQGMKAAGVYLSRSLSFDGVTQGMINHELTPDQKDIYNGLAETWQNLWLQMRQQAVDNGEPKFRGASLFWGQQQRFFNAAITALSMPSVIESAKADLEKGESVLFQLTNTGKAQQDREVARGERENLELEDLDFSPKQSMIDMVKELYPIFLYEPYTDDNGNEQTRLVTQPDANGDPQPVVNQEALANRDALIKNIEGVRVLDNPLDMIIDAFGVENVAEVTGRNARYVWEKDKDGAMKRVKHALSKNSRDKDVNAFMDGKKQVLIFSEAGGTGFSYHADNTRLNKQHRNHYLVQAGWQANKAIQGLGRSHRTNEASQPHYWLVTTDLRGQKRFISSIARRLDQLGALTRGQRETGGQGMFNAADNLENEYASGALTLFLRDMHEGQIEGMTLDNMASAKLGFDNLVNQQTGMFNSNNVPKTTQFLNRMLSLTYEDQNRVFEEFANRIDELVTTAKQNGTYDEGIKTLHAQKIEKVSEETLYQDADTGALANFVTLKLTHPMNFNDFESMQGLSSLANWQGFYWDRKNKRIAGVLKSGTKTQASGLVTNRGSVYLPTYKSSQKIYIDDLAKITDGKQKFGEKVMIPKYNGPVLYEEYHDEYYQRREGSQQVAVMLEHPNGEQEFKKNLENIKYQKRKEALEALYEKMKPHMGEQEVSIQVPQFEEKTKAEAAVLWQKGIAESPETFAETVNMIKGVILPIWDRIPGSTVGIRAQTADGEVIIGRDIQNKDVAELRRNFALGSLVSKLSGNEQWAKLNAGSEGTLSNGWRLNQVRVSGDKRIELIMSMATSGDVRMVESIGVFGEKISGSWSTRYFVPSETVFSALTELKPLVELTGLEGAAGTETENVSYSKAEGAVANPHSRDSLTNDVRAVLDDEFGKGFTNALLATGMHRIIDRKQALLIDPNSGNARGFYNTRDGISYLVSDNLSKDMSAKALFGIMEHEISIHQVLANRNDKEYKAFIDTLKRLKQAGNEKVLAAYAKVPKTTAGAYVDQEAWAEFSEAHPTLPLVKKFIAWLRAKIRDMAKLFPASTRFKFVQWAESLSENDLIYAAREALRTAPRQLKANQGNGNVTYRGESILASQSAMKSVDANIRRGREAMTKALLDKTTVHRAMFKTGMGWVDFVWGEEGGDITSKGMRPGAKGIAHILEARQRKDSLSPEDAENMLFTLVDTIAKGEEVNRVEVGKSTMVKIEDKTHQVILTRKQGSNTWMVTGFKLYKPGDGNAISDALPPTRYESTHARNEAGAGEDTITQPEESSNNDILYSLRSDLTAAAGKIKNQQDIQGVTEGVTMAMDGLLSAVAPQWRTDAAMAVARQINAVRGKQETQKSRFYQELKDALIVSNQNLTWAQKARDLIEKGLTTAADKVFVGQSKEDNYQFIQAVDTDDKSWLDAHPEQKAIAAIIDKMNAAKAKEIQDLGTGALKNLRENYFKHMWQDRDSEEVQKKIIAILAKRPLEGSKGWSKQRIYQDFQAGLDAGLKPLSDNPLDMVALDMIDKDYYILAHTVLNQLKKDGMKVFVRLGQKAQEGFVPINDPYGTVWGPGIVHGEEHIDEAVYEGLNKVAASMGVTHNRVVNAGRGKLGYTSKGGPVVTQHNTETSVLAHEIGHQIDFKYDLWQRIVKEAEGLGKRGLPTKTASQKARGIMARELRAIADEIKDRGAKGYSRKRVEQVAQMVEIYAHAPELMKMIAPNTFKAFDELVRSTPEISGMADIAPGIKTLKLGYEKKLGGPVLMGRYYVPEAIGQLLNNYLSPSLYTNKYVGGPFRAYMGSANVLNQFQLGVFSAFHAGFMANEAVINRNAMALKAMSEGNYKEGAHYFATSLKAAVDMPKTGGKILQELLRPGSNPEMAQIVEGLELAGYRWQIDNRFRTDSTRKMLANWSEGNKVRAGLHSINALVEQSARPIMEWLVPRYKFGVFGEKYSYWLKHNPNATHDEASKAANQLWTDTDATMGQVVYDRLFMHNYMKNFGQMLVRAPGWTGGTIYELTGGLKDLAGYAKDLASGKDFKGLSTRSAYTLSLLVTTSLANAILTALFTGEPPDDYKDLIAFRTGNLDEKGNAERMMLPNYMKDVSGYVEHGIPTTLGHKLHPALQLGHDIVVNRNYYGTEVYNEDDNLFQNMADIAGFTAKQFIPFWMQGVAKQQERDESAVNSVLPLVGIMPAPSYFNQTSAEKLMREYGADRLPQGARTQEEQDKSDLRRKIYVALRKGDKAQAQELFKEGRSLGITPQDFHRIVTKARVEPLINSFKTLTWPQAQKVWEAATDEEKAKLKPLYMKKKLAALRMEHYQYGTEARQGIGQ